MERSGVVFGLVLISLLFCGQSAEEVDQNSLAKIISTFQSRYNPATHKVEDFQYAVAINVPARQCGRQFDENSFLSQDNADRVKTDLLDNVKHLYQGQQLVAATPTGVSSSSKVHSERALLMCSGSEHAVSPVKNLLNKDKKGCVVFYTSNSPCLDVCLNQAKDDMETHRVETQRGKGRSNVTPAVQKCILNSLKMLSDHSGPKAFVFGQVYRKDKNKPGLEDALKKIAEQVPLYRCTTNSCVKCLKGNQIDRQCLS